MLTACVSTARQPRVTGNRAVGYPSIERQPAEESRPPLIDSREIWAYSWTINPLALSNPKQKILTTFQRTRSCLEKLRGVSPETEVPDCEGNGMAAGPGLYTVDNPFTSHDYGSTLLMVKIVPGRRSVGLATGRFAARPADGGMAREWVTNSNYEAFLYDFRPNDLGGRALVLRTADLIHVEDVQGLDLRPKIWSKFREHAKSACTENSTTPEILAAWSDQMEFLSLVFNGLNDPSGQSFGRAGNPNIYAIAAAVASDAVAIDDLALAELAKILRSHSIEIRESLDRCNETDTMTLRSCLSQRIFVSLKGDEGTPQRPTGAWSFETTKKALVELRVVAKGDASPLKSHSDLLTLVQRSFLSEKTRAARVNEAFACSLIAKKRSRLNNFEAWAADPR